MPSVTIRNLSSETYERLKERARSNRRSITQEAAWLLEAALAAPVTPAETWAEVAQLRETIRRRYGSFTDSVPLVQEDRGR